ncbi:hypothetical protein [Geminicoccus flavidas]|uniref:hypothetical protein n=1 Tax=Geminicoccus flavidas TaxID=2506407 RepID=UPI0013572874|nr:hypothetical protein [Geminicoccus flavidas]
MLDRPRRNRVTPFGTIEASLHRGRYLGNRGDLHMADGTLGRSWRVWRWITCTLQGRNGYRVTFDRRGCYYPLFFADEAVALAAGHRPCAQCRRADFLRFRASRRQAHGLPADQFVSADEIDRALHPARIDRNGHQVAHAVPLGDLPEGMFVTLTDAPEVPFLLWEGSLHPWIHQGYAVPHTARPDAMARVLTPLPTVSTLRASYRRCWMSCRQAERRPFPRQCHRPCRSDLRISARTLRETRGWWSGRDWEVVGATGIEPVTPTMSTGRFSKVSKD